MQRNAAVSMVAGFWTKVDRDAVRRWVLSLPPGEKRDVALAAALRTVVGEPDAALVNAFSDDRARQAAMMGAVLNTATADRDAARRLMNAYITDPRLRAEAERLIENMPQRGMTMVGPGGTPAGGLQIVTPSQLQPSWKSSVSSSEQLCSCAAATIIASHQLRSWRRSRSRARRMTSRSTG